MIVISPNDIKIKHENKTYILRSFPFIGIHCSYLYYEPEINRYKKVTLTQTLEEQTKGYEDELTDDEKLICQQFLTSLNNLNILTEFLSEHEKQSSVINSNLNDEPPKIPKPAVDSDGIFMGQVVLPKEGLFEVPSFPPKDLYVEPFGISYKWDHDNDVWIVNGDYKEKRKYEYLNQTNIGDQLDAIISAIDSLSKQQALPEKFNELVTIVNNIKLANPKT